MRWLPMVVLLSHCVPVYQPGLFHVGFGCLEVQLARPEVNAFTRSFAMTGYSAIVEVRVGNACKEQQRVSMGDIHAWAVHEDGVAEPMLLFGLGSITVAMLDGHARGKELLRFDVPTNSLLNRVVDTCLDVAPIAGTHAGGARIICLDNAPASHVAFPSMVRQ